MLYPEIFLCLHDVDCDGRDVRCGSARTYSLIRSAIPLINELLTVVKSKRVVATRALNRNKGTVGEGTSILDEEHVVVHGESGPFHQCSLGNGISGWVRSIYKRQ